MADPVSLLADNIVRNGAQLRQIGGGVWLQKEGIESGASNVSADALVIDHVIQRHAEVAVQIGRRLTDRDPEGGHQVAEVDVAFPEKPELEPALNAPPNAALRCPHLCIPVS